MGADAGKVGLMKKSMYGTRDAASNWERDWQGHVQKWGFQLGLSSKNLFHHREDRVSGLIHGDDFVITGPTEKLMEVERKMTSLYPIKAKVISSRVVIEHQNFDTGGCTGTRTESCTNMIPDTSTYS